MRIAVKLTLGVLAAVPLAGAAQEPKLNCTKDMSYSAEFLEKFPNASAACNEVIKANGQKWVRFNAVVKSRQGNHLTVSFIDGHHNSVAIMTFSFDPTARVTLEDHEQKAATLLEEGDKLLIWMPESRIGLYPKPDATQGKHFTLISDETNKQQEE
jgi:hypothetical protein